MILKLERVKRSALGVGEAKGPKLAQDAKCGLGVLQGEAGSKEVPRLRDRQGT